MRGERQRKKWRLIWAEHLRKKEEERKRKEEEEALKRKQAEEELARIHAEQEAAEYVPYCKVFCFFS